MFGRLFELGLPKLATSKFSEAQASTFLVDEDCSRCRKLQVIGEARNRLGFRQSRGRKSSCHTWMRFFKTTIHAAGKCHVSTCSFPDGLQREIRTAQVLTGGQMQFSWLAYRLRNLGERRVRTNIDRGSRHFPRSSTRRRRWTWA